MVQISARSVILGAVFGMTMASPIAFRSQPHPVKRTAQGHLYMTSASQTTPAQGKYLFPSKRGEVRVGSGLYQRAPVHVHQIRRVSAAAYDTLSKREGNSHSVTQLLEAIWKILGLKPPTSGSSSTSHPKQAILAIINPDVNGGDQSSLATQSKDITGNDGSTIFILTNAAPPNDNASSSESSENAGNDGSHGIVSLTNSGSSKSANTSPSRFSASGTTEPKDPDGSSPGIAFLTNSQASKTNSNASSSGFSSSGTPVFVSGRRQPVAGASSGKSVPKESGAASFNTLTPEIMAVADSYYN